MWIVVEEGVAIDADDVRRYCDGKIARFKIPRYVRIVEEFPLTVTGKVQKFRMREQELDALGLRATGQAETA